MVKPRIDWLFELGQKRKIALPPSLKQEVDSKAAELIANVLKPKYVLSQPVIEQTKAIVDMIPRWIRDQWYLLALFCTYPFHIHPLTFEVNLARMVYIGAAKFNLSFLRHDDRLFKHYSELSIDECLNAIREEAWV